jgi:ubiquinone/menaquinone biosynthesis C-methylase UbiE
MRSIKKITFFITPYLWALLLNAQSPHYSFKNFGTYFEEFQQEEDLKHFLDIRKGNVIADVGAGDGYFTVALSLLYDSVTFFVEDISKRQLKKRKIKKYLNHFTKLKGGPQTNTYNITLGTYTSTNLPGKSFDKIIMMASFHEFSNMNEMVSDIAGKLKAGGKVYVMEAFSLKGDTIYCADKHKGYTISQVVAIMESHGLYLTWMRSPEGKTINHSNCLVFEQNREKSVRFYENKDYLKQAVAMCKSLTSIAVASDTCRVNNILDSLKPYVKLIPTVYSAFDDWLRLIGRSRMEKQDFKSAINVLKATCSLFPGNYTNYLFLARAYQAEGRYREALKYYNTVISLNPKCAEANKQASLLMKIPR